MCTSVSQPVRNIGIAEFAGIAALARLRRLNVIASGCTCRYNRTDLPYAHNPESTSKILGLDLKGNVNEEIDCWLEDPCNLDLTRPAWLIAAGKGY